ncbi:MAG: sulfotransferase domain-containing protein [Rhodanobacteraceae bacterium]
MASADKPLPAGLAIGPMRTGSTWLYQYLLSRKDVCLPKDVKETFYFAEKFGMGESWYENHFRHYDPASHRKIVEVAPTLFDNHAAMARVRKVLGNPVLLVTLRQPIERTWSHYLHLRQYGTTTLGFDAAIREMPAIIEPSLYAKHLAIWIDEFGHDAVHVMFYKDLKRKQAEYVQHVDRALGLPPAPAQAPPAARVNAGGLPRNLLLAKIGHRAAAQLRLRGLHRLVNAGKRAGLSNLVYGRSRGAAPKPSMNRATRNYLIERFATDVTDLERLLDINLDAWRETWAARRED